MKFLIVYHLFFCFALCSASDGISSLSYHLSLLVDNPTDELKEEIENLWEEAHHSDTLDLARFYFGQNTKEGLQHAIECLDYLTEARSPYPNFDGNPLINSAMHRRMKPHLLPQNHPIKPIVDILFSTAVTENIASFTAAGFQILFDQPTSFVKVCSHPCTPGYLYKIYLDDEVRQKSHRPGWHWLCNRCEGADKIRRFIKKKKIKYFSVPDKFLYPLAHHNPNSPCPQPVVLIVTDMHIASEHRTLAAWKTKVTKKHLDELHSILTQAGGGSRFLSGNVPYTHGGKFAFVDTEYPKRKVNVEKVAAYLSPEMQKYWHKIIKKKK